MDNRRGKSTIRPPFWPIEDQKAFDLALRPKEFRRGGGTAGHLRPATVKGYKWIYGRWIRFLTDHYPDSLRERPQDRLTEDRIWAFIEELEETISPLSVWSYLSHLHNTAYCVMAEHDWIWLRDIVNHLHATLPVGGIDETTLVGIDEIYALGFEMMAEAERGQVKKSNIAPHYRNGLLLALGAETLMRPANLTTLEIGRYLLKPSSRWQIAIPADEVKNEKRIDQTLSEPLSKAIDTYLDVHRLKLLEGNQSDLMWINHQGQEMKQHAVSQRVMKVTERRLGKPVAIQRFRNCAATTIATRRPHLVGITPIVLRHWSGVTYQQHYNRASQTTALSRYHDSISDLKKEEPSCAP